METWPNGPAPPRHTNERNTVPFYYAFTRRYAKALTSSHRPSLERPAHLAIYVSMR